MKKLLYIVIILLVFSCGTDAQTPTDAKWEIVNEAPAEKSNSCLIEINLAEKVEASTLEKIANELKETRGQYDKLWIYYYHPSKSLGKAWASSHFKPELDVKILGTTLAQDQALTSSEGFLGKWRSDNSLAGSILTLSEVGEEEFLIKISYNDEVRMSSNVKKYMVDGKPKFIDETSHGEYFIIETNGNLGMYNSNGKFDEAVKIK